MSGRVFSYVFKSKQPTKPIQSKVEGYFWKYLSFGDTQHFWNSVFFNSLIDGVYEQKNIFILPLDNTSKNDISILYELFHIKHFLLNRIVSKVKK